MVPEQRGGFLLLAAAAGGVIVDEPQQLDAALPAVAGQKQDAHVDQHGEQQGQEVDAAGDVERCAEVCGGRGGIAGFGGGLAEPVVRGRQPTLVVQVTVDGQALLVELPRPAGSPWSKAISPRCWAVTAMPSGSR